MKLQELLRKCDFDRMFEYIVKFDSKSEGSRFAYLVAYELLFRNIHFYVMMAQHICKRRKPFANHERNPQVGVEQNFHNPCRTALISA